MRSALVALCCLGASSLVGAQPYPPGTPTRPGVLAPRPGIVTPKLTPVPTVKCAKNVQCGGDAPGANSVRPNAGVQPLQRNVGTQLALCKNPPCKVLAVKSAPAKPDGR